MDGLRNSASLSVSFSVPSLFTVLPRFWVCKIMFWNFLIPSHLHITIFFFFFFFFFSFSASFPVSSSPLSLPQSQFLCVPAVSICLRFSLLFFLFLDKWVGAWKVTSPNSATYGILKNKPYTCQYLKWAFLLTCQHLVKSFCFYILYMIGKKKKTSFGKKNSFGENLGGGDK